MSPFFFILMDVKALNWKSEVFHTSALNHYLCIITR